MSAIDGVVALVGAVQRHEHVGVDRRRRAQVDEPAADGELVAGGLEVDRRGADASPPAARSKMSTSSGSVSPITAAESGLMMPAFSRAMSASVGPANSVWSMPMLVTTATWAVDDVGGVPPAEQPDLDHRDVDGDVGEPAEGGGGARLEVARPDAGEPLEVGDRGDLLGELVVVDRLAVAGDALVDPLEVRAGVGADGEPLGHQQAGDHLRRRALAVGAGDVDHRGGVLRIAHRLRRAG